jgi:hypothetical protein
MDGNSGTGIGYPPCTRPDGDEYGYDFLPVGGTHTRPEPRRIGVRIFSPPTGVRYPKLSYVSIFSLA